MKCFLLFLGSSIGLGLVSMHPSDVQASPACDEKQDVPKQYSRVVRNQLIVRYPLTDPPGSAEKSNCDKLCDLLKIE
jgi:hypothetical protein